MKNTLILIALMIFSSIFGQTLNDKYAEDVKSVDTIMDAYYDVVSGASSDPWQFERDNYLHSHNALITRLDANGNADSHALEVEYIPMGLVPREDFYEKELKRKMTRYGNMAQVWSAFEIRTNPDVASNVRGLNSIQLHFENDRWYIDSWTAEMESDKNALVTDFLKRP
jgi:hypothetical protein